MSRKNQRNWNYGVPFANYDLREPFLSQYNYLNLNPYNNIAMYVNPTPQFSGNVAPKPVNNRPANDKSNLYRRPEIFNRGLQNTGNAINNSNLLISSSWTDQYWQKHGGAAKVETGKTGKKSKKCYNKVEKTLNKMLAKPVEMSKGRSLLEKMGWTGGGLGKDGEGIVEPIAPKATYATNTIGLGLHTETDETKTKGKRRNNNERKEKLKKSKMTKGSQPSGEELHTVANQKETKGKRRNNNESKKGKKQMPKKKQPKSQKDPKFILTEEDIEFKMNFRRNVLLRILNFVKDDAQPKVVFKEQLSRYERKKVHDIVENIRQCEDPYNFVFENEAEIEIVENIIADNHYILYTQSEGEGILRRLSVYKQPSDDILLITPKYLRDTESNDGVGSKDIVNDETECDEIFIDLEEDLESLRSETASIVENDKSNENAMVVEEDAESMNYETAAIDEDDGAKCKDNAIDGEEDAESMIYETAAIDEDDGAKCKDDAVDGEEDAESMIYDTAAIVEENYEAKSKGNITVEEDSEPMNYETAAIVDEGNKDDAESMNYETDVIAEGTGAAGEEAESISNETAAIVEKDNVTESYEEDEENKKDVKVNDETAVKDNKGINDIIKDKLMSKLINYLKIFVNKKKLKELRYLGTFNEDEFEVIQLFFNICSGRVCDDRYKIKEILKHELYNLEVCEDSNGSCAIYKTTKKPKKLDY